MQPSKLGANAARKRIRCEGGNQMRGMESDAKKEQGVGDERSVGHDLQTSNLAVPLSISAILLLYHNPKFPHSTEPRSSASPIAGSKFSIPGHTSLEHLSMDNDIWTARVELLGNGNDAVLMHSPSTASNSPVAPVPSFAEPEGVPDGYDDSLIDTQFLALSAVLETVGIDKTVDLPS
ncbi:hypothetical protein E6O75_ATG05792 [Venturia nashicola]|uniref:Uncharacterized protein n=1 Tax=Venturia nashicola TaxID=86259 RepID=A0A4Z1NYL7_9PEZI|nr:hypothetical protein E6O75_ATG05792 [Venturia nashicola]